jgi:beta-lactam-binding protein with PASTA domain
VPSVRGLTLREAVRSLHAAGFRVQLAPGASEGTSPASGALAAPGTIVRLLFNY